MKKLLILVFIASTMMTCKVKTDNSALFLIIRGTPSVVISQINATIDDMAIVTVAAAFKDLSIVGSTAYTQAIIDQIDVSYYRSDGKNVQGKDVPYSYSMRYTTAINAGAEIPVNLVIVRSVAKLEPPLIDLMNLTQEKVLIFYARFVVHAKDTGGHRLKQVTGEVTIHCARVS